MSGKAAAALIALAVSLALLMQALAQGAAYPTRPVSLIVPFPPGASTDLIARYLAPKLKESLGQTVVVENRPGAAGTLGAAYVAKSAPDGHTLLVASSTVTKGPLLQKNPVFDPDQDLAPIAMTFHQPFVVAVSSTVPVRTIGDLVAHAKANPGKLNMSTLGGFSDLMSEMFKRAAGVDMQIVPYRGAAEAIMGLVRGDAHVTLNAYLALEPQVVGGQIRVLAVTSLSRSAAMPGMPTLAESGFPGFDIINVIGLLAPAATPEPIVTRLSEEIARIMTTPDAREFVKSRSNDAVFDFSAQYYAAYLRRDGAKFKKVIEDIGFPKQ
jgi:tripartite-type tricarboxylate transporter receptor subunit TctC